MVVERTWTNKFPIPESKDTEITESFLQYQRVSNQDLRALCVLRGQNSYINLPNSVLSLFQRASELGFSLT